MSPLIQDAIKMKKWWCYIFDCILNSLSFVRKSSIYLSSYQYLLSIPTINSSINSSINSIYQYYWFNIVFTNLLSIHYILRESTIVSIPSINSRIDSRSFSWIFDQCKIFANLLPIRNPFRGSASFFTFA